MAIRVPVIEIANHADPFGIGRPHRKAYASLAFVLHEVATHFFIQPKMFAALKEGNIEVREQGEWLDHVIVYGLRWTVYGRRFTVDGQLRASELGER